MQITTEQLYSRLAGLERVFSYKRVALIDAKKIPAISKKIYDGIPFRKKTAQFERFVLSAYSDLASNISSCTISMHKLDAYFLGELVRTNAFPKINTFGNALRFDEVASFYSAKTVQEQLAKIQAVSEANNTAIAKFTKQNKSVFDIRENQTSLLYDMLVNGEISIIVYAHLMQRRHIMLDYSKMDATVYRNNKIAEYVASFNLSKLLAK